MELRQIKSHPYFPFRNFRSDDLAFLLLELYWVELFKDIVPPSAVESWRPQFPADRADGNPILHVINRSMSPPRALRIIQRFNEDRLVELDLDRMSEVRFSGDAYVPFVPGLTEEAVDEDGTTPVDELVISSDISESCERLAREFIKAWCVEPMMKTAMRERIDAYWKRIRSHLIEATE